LLQSADWLKFSSFFKVIAVSAEVRREWTAILNHWVVAGVALTLATGIGTAVVAPSTGAGLWQRAAFAALGVLAGIVAVMLAALVIALLRVPAAEYRERHRLRKLGQELMDVGYEMIYVAAPYARAEDGSVALANPDDWHSLAAKYNTSLAARIFHTGRELEKHDVLTRERRDALNESPEDLPSYFERVVELVGWGNQLGAEHPPPHVATEMISGEPSP
jgi:hypothetical protein